MGPEMRPMKTSRTKTKENAMRRVIVFVIAAAAIFIPLAPASAHITPCTPGVQDPDGHLCFPEQSSCDSGVAPTGVYPGAPVSGVGNAGSGTFFRGAVCVNSPSGGTVLYVGGSGSTSGPCGEAWIGDDKVQDTDATDNNANECP